MTKRHGRDERCRTLWIRLTRLAPLTVVVSLASGVAWAYWTAGSVPGGNGASAVATVNPVATPPTASAAGDAVTVSWDATTLSTGTPVAGYIVKRYDAGTLALQAILPACTATISATTCIENSIPAGSWRYSVTPVFATNWQGAESAKSETVAWTAPTGTGVAPALGDGSYKAGRVGPVTKVPDWR